MFIRRKPNKSGSTSIQIVEKRQGRNKVIESIGCSKDEEKLKELEFKAQKRLESLNPQQFFDFGISPQDQRLLDLIGKSSIQSIGPEIILGSIFDKIGFSAIPEELFKDIVIARLVYKSSQITTHESFNKKKGKEIAVTSI